jgi:S1-C subfamily serine protease
LIRHGEVVQPWIGLTVQDLDAGLSQYLNLPEPGSTKAKGVVVKDVEPSSPASNAGIHSGDILLSIANRPLSSTTDYHSAVNEIPAGDTAVFDIWRNGKTLSLSLKSSVFPDERAPALAYKLLGIRVQNPAMRKRTGHQPFTSTGVVISEINPSSKLARIGVKPGDIVHQIDDIGIGSVEEFNKAIVKYRRKASVVILLQRADQLYNITVDL